MHNYSRVSELPILCPWSSSSILEASICNRLEISKYGSLEELLLSPQSTLPVSDPLAAKGTEIIDPAYYY
jgi:hypothetical protein